MSASRRRGRIGGLRGQLLLALIGLLLLALSLVALATLQLHKRQLQQSVAEEARRHAEVLVAVDDPELRAQQEANLRELPAILFAGPLTEELSAQVLVPEPGSVALIRYQQESAVIARSQGQNGAVVIVSLAQARQAIATSRQALLLYLGLTLVFVTLVGYAFYSFVVIRPLSALGVAAARAAEGDLASPVQVLPRNEIGAVSRQFNAMLERLDAQQTALKEQLEELTRAHEELQQTQDSLIRSEKLASVGQLAAGIAHEVGNPLAAVMGYTDLLKDRHLSEEMADDLSERSLTQLKRIRTIIRQLLDYSRPEPDTTPQPVAVSSVIDEALHLVKAMARAKGVEFHVELDENLPKACVVAGELSQVLVNLLINAVHALDGSGNVHISATHSDNRVVITVADDGPGVPEEHARRIFDPFFTTASPGEGTGLGLAISQRLIARVGGELELLPSDQGALFGVKLPVA